MRTVKSDAQGYPQVIPILATTLTRGGPGNLTATFTATKAHKLTTGTKVLVKGADVRPFNTEQRVPRAVTVVSPTVFTYVLDMDPGADATVTNVIAFKQIEEKEYEPFAVISRNTNRMQVEPMGASMGEFGFDLINDAANRTSKAYGILVPITDCVINTLTSSGLISGSFATLTLKAGVPYNIPIVTQIQLTSGALLAYLWQPA